MIDKTNWITWSKNTEIHPLEERLLNILRSSGSDGCSIVCYIQKRLQVIVVDLEDGSLLEKVVEVPRRPRDLWFIASSLTASWIQTSRSSRHSIFTSSSLRRASKRICFRWAEVVLARVDSKVDKTCATPVRLACLCPKRRERESSSILRSLTTTWRGLVNMERRCTKPATALRGLAG